MIKVGIVGGTGYTGVELIRLLLQHPEAKLEVITSRSEAGRPVSDLFSNLRGKLDLTFSQPELETYRNCDLVFFATPNTTAMKQAEALLEASGRGVRVRAVFEREQAEAAGSDVRRLQQAGLDVRLDNREGTLHHKLLLIDGRLVATGSYNFTDSSSDSNIREYSRHRVQLGVQAAF